MTLAPNSSPQIDGGRGRLGPIGRLGHCTATRFGAVGGGWVVLGLGLGVLGPRAEKALAGAGWEATGSESVQARHLIDGHFDGLGSYALVVVVHAEDRTFADPVFRGTLRRVQA